MPAALTIQGSLRESNIALLTWGEGARGTRVGEGGGTLDKLQFVDTSIANSATGRYHPTQVMRSFFLWTAVVFVTGASVAQPRPPVLGSGFRLLYETRFEQARSEFVARETADPQDPVAHAWEAASYLFEVFYRHGILTSQFFLNDDKLLGGAGGEVSDAHRTAFYGATAAAQKLATERLEVNPRDPKALFAMTITTGMLADYSSLIEKRQLKSLKFIRKSEAYAQKLLAVRPDSADAYVALGAANYIIGSLPVHKRVLLWLGGIKGDKQLGMKQLAIAASKGDSLRPFAKILLALADLREKKPDQARLQFEDLAAEFPENPLFARELALQEREAKTGRSGL